MTVFKHLAEAKIRAFQQQQKASAGSQQPPHGVAARDAPLEVQLFTRILELRARAEQCSDDAERTTLQKQASNLQTQLLVLLETTGRPLAAQRLAESLASGKLL